VGGVGVTERVAVVVDGSAVPRNPSGAGRYVIELATALGQRDDVALTVLSRRGDEAWWRQLTDATDVAGLAPRSRPARLVWEQVGMARALRRLDPDVHHGPHYTMPERFRGPVVVTIHDLTFFDHPEWHEATKARFFQRATRVAAERATALVCVSNTTAERLEAIVSPRAAVHVIPHGVDHARYRPGDADKAGPPYIGFVGTLEPRKDIPTLIRAFDLVAQRHPDVRLRIAGHSAWGRRAVDDAVAASSSPDRIDLVGYLAEDDVPPFLRSAAAVAYPSLAEGFGQPALEAMACGAPLVTTTGSAMEEVVGDGALLVPPSSPGDLADALRSILEDGQATERRRARGLEIASRYTWAASAEAHVEVYRKAVGTLPAR
jgi:glycosyltransferase involved in cell wall biosynthesis